MTYYVKFIDGKSYWSDMDHSDSDKIPYYKIDESLGLKVGHPFKLVDNVATPFDKDETAKHEDETLFKRVAGRKKYKLLKEYDRSFKTIPKEAHKWLGLGEFEKYYSDDMAYLKVLIGAQTLLLLPKSENATLAAKWILTLAPIRKIEYEDGLQRIDTITTIEELEKINYKDGSWFKNLPFIEL